MTTDHEARAREIVRSGFDGHDVKMCNGESLVAAIVSALREAEAGEREACAKIAENDDSFMMLQDFGLQSAVTQKGQNIAAAIRSRNDE